MMALHFAIKRFGKGFAYFSRFCLLFCIFKTKSLKNKQKNGPKENVFAWSRDVPEDEQ